MKEEVVTWDRAEGYRVQEKILTWGRGVVGSAGSGGGGL